MSNQNTEGLANQMPTGGSGEFNPKAGGSEPLQEGGHQPGKLVGNDAVPEFNAKTLPPGSAPADRTFPPNNATEARADDNTASATLGGASSADVHTGVGHPGAGQSSAEQHHDGQAHRKNPGASLQGVGASTNEFKTADAHDPDKKHLRALDKDEAEVGRGTTGGPAAQERVPENADTVASERR